MRYWISSYFIQCCTRVLKNQFRPTSKAKKRGERERKRKKRGQKKFLLPFVVDSGRKCALWLLFLFFIYNCLVCDRSHWPDSRTLVQAATCHRMWRGYTRGLTHADVCWHMLTYADVCWSMLTKGLLNHRVCVLRFTSDSYATKISYCTRY